MKKLIFILFLMPVLGFSQPVTDGLVGYWPFNGNANDESGNGNDGTVNGATLTTDRFGNANSAFEFDGMDDYIDISSVISMLNSSNQGTWSIWVKAFDNSPSDHEYILAFANSNSETAIRVVRRSTGVLGGLNFNVKKSGTHQFSMATEEVAIPQESWVHIALVHNGEGPIIYVNGEIVPQSFITDYDTNAWFSDVSLNNGRIGCRKWNNEGNTYHFNGKIDDINIYNRALTEQEIQTLYSGQITSPELCNDLYCDGQNIGIGTSDTQGYKLAVAGDFIAQKVKVALQDQWPDYVFDEDYNLQDLQQLEQYIKTHKHLPNIPDAKTIENNGYELSDMDAKLLEKIEELSLYIIEQEKKIQNQHKKLIKQEKKFESQQNELDRQESINKAQEEKFLILEERLKELENQ